MLASSRRPRANTRGEEAVMDLSNLLSSVSQATGGADPAQLASAVQETFASKGGVDGLIGTLRQGGLGGAVDSWISTGPNQPVEPQQVGAALGPQNVNQISAKSGLPVEALLPLLATFLPMIIDMLTPDGNAPQTGADGGMGQIGDLLGGLLGAR
jgi:uncharacterized protein YidB (DUF937 family)